MESRTSVSEGRSEADRLECAVEQAMSSLGVASRAARGEVHALLGDLSRSVAEVGFFSFLFSFFFFSFFCFCFCNEELHWNVSHVVRFADGKFNRGPFFRFGVARNPNGAVCTTRKGSDYNSLQTVGRIAGSADSHARDPECSVSELVN